jgi:hypothetical protein
MYTFPKEEDLGQIVGFSRSSVSGHSILTAALGGDYPTFTDSKYLGERGPVEALHSRSGRHGLPSESHLRGRWPGANGGDPSAANQKPNW